MKLSSADKETIRRLRSNGHTFSETQSVLGHRVAKSSLSYICRGVNLPSSYASKVRVLNTQSFRAARALAVQKNKDLLQNRSTRLALQANETLDGASAASLKLALALLYLGEGSKWRSYRGLSLGSADAVILSIYVRLLERCYGIAADGLRARVQHRMDQDSAQLVRYWSEVTGVPERQFYKSYADRRTAGKPTKRSDYRGVCVIICSGTEIQLELAALAEQLCARLDRSLESA